MKSLQVKLLYAFVCASLLLALVGIRPAYAATLTVTNANDSGPGSLRDAITSAASGDTINFASSLSGATITLVSTLIISQNLTIDGSSLAVPITISGNNRVGVMDITAGMTVNLNTLTIIDGSVPYCENGGGIANNGGTLTIQNSAINNNKTACNGGGIANNGGTLTVTNSTFSGNSATAGGFGGGIYNDGGTLTVTNSTFSGNSATASGYGGGIYNQSGTFTITNSTFSGNSADGNGGGIYIEGGTLNLLNTIITNSTNGDCISDGGSISSEHNNLIQGTTYTCGLTNGINNDIVGSDPNLGSLADNGGKTQTMALLSGSPAIDAGNDAICAASPVNGKDQRGVTRPQGAHCDIGSYESGPVIPIVTASTPAANATLSSLSTITVTFNQDMLNDGSSKAANDVNNYLLVGQGTNGVFDTKSCKGGWQSDDLLVPISNASYSNSGGTYIATLTLGSSLPAGHYQLFICGTTSIWSAAGLELNNGKNDTTLDFTINASPSTGNSGGANFVTSSLPSTGFPQGQVTVLPAQPLSKAYSSTDLILSIPSLNINTSIVGVPQSDNGWDVSWLGNDAGWLNGTAFPTWTGNSVITGHVWNADNTPGVFVNLKNLKYGNQIQIQAFGQTYTYEVRESRIVWPDQSDMVLKHEDQSWITLLTCEDYNLLFTTYSFRRMVRAVLVSVQ